MAIGITPGAAASSRDAMQLLHQLAGFQPGNYAASNPYLQNMAARASQLQAPTQQAAYAGLRDVANPAMQQDAYALLRQAASAPTASNPISMAAQTVSPYRAQAMSELSQMNAQAPAAEAAAANNGVAQLATGSAGGAGGGGGLPTALGGAAGEAAGAGGEGLGAAGAAAGGGGFLGGAGAGAGMFSGIGGVIGGGIHGIGSVASRLPVVGRFLKAPVAAPEEGAALAAGETAGFTALPLAVGYGVDKGIQYVIPKNSKIGNYSLNPTRTVLGDAALGAGAGATAGSVIPGVGTAIGGLAGGTLGALKGGYDALRDAGKPSVKDPVFAQLQQQVYGMPDLAVGDQHAVLRNYILNTTLDDSKKGRQAAAAQAIQEVQQRQAQSAQLAAQQQATLMSQANIARFMQPGIDNANRFAQSAAAYQNQAAQFLPPELAAIARQDAANHVAQTAAQGNQYAMQAQMIPAGAGYNYQQQLINQALNARMSPLIQQAAGASSGSGLSLNNALSAAAGG